MPRMRVLQNNQVKACGVVSKRDPERMLSVVELPCAIVVEQTSVGLIQTYRDRGGPRHIHLKIRMS